MLIRTKDELNKAQFMELNSFSKRIPLRNQRKKLDLQLFVSTSVTSRWFRYIPTCENFGNSIQLVTDASEDLFICYKNGNASCYHFIVSINYIMVNSYLVAELC